MTTINTVVENLILLFDMVYNKVVFEGSKDELLDRIEHGGCLIHFTYEGADRKMHELVTRGENILSLEFPIKGAGVPAGIKPAPKKMNAEADNIIPFPIRNRMTQPEKEKPMTPFQLNNERTQDGPRIVVATPEEFMAETGMSEEEFVRLISTSAHLRL